MSRFNPYGLPPGHDGVPQPTPQWVKHYSRSGDHVVVQARDDQGLLREELWYRDCMLDRVDGPARQAWYPDGEREETWYRAGQHHRDHGPAVQAWQQDGTLVVRQWCRHGQFHRVEGPAWEEWDEEGRPTLVAWYRDGQRHRADGPAWQQWSAGQIRAEEWVQHGRRHRPDGPAIRQWGADGFLEREQFSLHGTTCSADELTKPDGTQH